MLARFSSFSHSRIVSSDIHDPSGEGTKTRIDAAWRNLNNGEENLYVLCDVEVSWKFPESFESE
jgi:hypothetical protein